MSKLTWRVTPVNGYDIPALERWLEDMAAQGSRFFMTTGPLCGFEPMEPTPLRVYLQPIRHGTEPDSELSSLFEEAGWSYLGSFRGSYFVYSNPDMNAQAHTDPDVLDYALKRFTRQRWIVGAGLLFLNIVLLSIFGPGADILDPNSFFWFDVRCFPVEALSSRHLVPYALSCLSLLLLDLSYLFGLLSLRHYRKTIHTGPRSAAKRSGGWLLATGVLLLIPVILELSVSYFGLDYQPYPLSESNFITLTEIEGADLRLSGDPMYNMDRISHGVHLLEPDNWYFQQYGSFSHHDGGLSLNEVPHLEISISRYRFSSLAKGRVNEWGGSGYEGLPPSHGLDQILVSRGENGMNLIIRQSSTVLHADYRGEKDLTDHLDRFAEMLEEL